MDGSEVVQHKKKTPSSKFTYTCMGIFTISLQVILKAAGASLANLVDLTVFLVDMQHYQGFNEVNPPSQ